MKLKLPTDINNKNFRLSLQSGTLGGDELVAEVLNDYPPSFHVVTCTPDHLVSVSLPLRHYGAHETVLIRSVPVHFFRY